MASAQGMPLVEENPYPKVAQNFPALNSFTMDILSKNLTRKHLVS